MDPVEWPIAAPAADRPVELARRAGGDRLDTVRRDFFLSPDDRLSEQERALMTAMLHGLVANLADELRATLPVDAAEACEIEPEELIAELNRVHLLDRADLVGLLLRRADPDRIAGAMRALHDPHRSPLLQGLVADGDAALAAAAMTLILARGRRRDRFGQSLLDFNDLPAECAVAVVHSIAAVLRPLIDRDQADPMLARATAGLLARHDEGLRFEALVAALVRAVDEAGRLDDEWLAATAREGELDLLSAGLARRAGIAGEDSARHLETPGDGRLMLLVRMAGGSRTLAARLLAELGELLGIGDPGAEIAQFDSIDDISATRALAWLRLDPHYRSAIAALGSSEGGADGQRPV